MADDDDPQKAQVSGQYCPPLAIEAKRCAGISGLGFDSLAAHNTQAQAGIAPDPGFCVPGGRQPNRATPKQSPPWPPRLTPASLLRVLEQEVQPVHRIPLDLFRHVDVNHLRRGR
jgi:hypothetical protein